MSEAPLPNTHIYVSRMWPPSYGNTCTANDTYVSATQLSGPKITTVEVELGFKEKAQWLKCSVWVGFLGLGSPLQKM